MSGIHAPRTAGGHDVRVVDLSGEAIRPWCAACLDCNFATLHRTATAAAAAACEHWQDSVHRMAAAAAWRAG